MGKGPHRRNKRRRNEREYDDRDREEDHKTPGSISWVRENIHYLVIGFAVVILILAVVLISVLTPENGPNEEPNGNGEGWQDMELLETYLGSTPYGLHYLKGTSDITSKASGKESSSLLMLVGVEEELSGNDVVAINDFLNAGGSVIIADDGNLTNKLTEKWKVVLDGSQVIQEEFFYNISFINADAYVEGYRYNVMFNAPTGFTSTGDAEVMCKASEDVDIVLDKNENYVLDGVGQDLWAPNIPFMVRLRVGPGTLVVISDTGLFTNNLFGDGRFENREFTTKLITSLVPDDGHIYYDNSKQVSLYSGHVLLPK